MTEASLLASNRSNKSSLNTDNRKPHPVTDAPSSAELIRRERDER